MMFMMFKNKLMILPLQLFAETIDYKNPDATGLANGLPLTSQSTVHYDSSTGARWGGLNELLPDGYYFPALLDSAEKVLVHTQFGTKFTVPQGNGLVAFWQRREPLEKALAPLTEGVTPGSTPMDFSTVSATLYQYGAVIPVTDISMMVLRQDMKMQAALALGDQAGRTLDTICREKINEGNNVIFADGTKSARYMVKGDDATAANNDTMTPSHIFRAERQLFKGGAKRFPNGYYAAIIHPDVQFDLMRSTDKEWIGVKENDPDDYYEGKVGNIGGVAFYRTDEAKIFQPDKALVDLINTVSSDAGYLTVAAVANKVITVTDTITGTGLVGKTIQYYDASAGAVKELVVDSVEANATTATSTDITCTENVGITYASGDLVYPGGAGYRGRHIYSTLVCGQDAYGVVDLEGGNLQFIWKELGSGNDPLNQRASSGWKALFAAAILNEDWIVRLETASTENSDCN